MRIFLEFSQVTRQVVVVVSYLRSQVNMGRIEHHSHQLNVLY